MAVDVCNGVFIVDMHLGHQPLQFFFGFGFFHSPLEVDLHVAAAWQNTVEGKLATQQLGRYCGIVLVRVVVIGFLAILTVLDLLQELKV